MSSTLVQFRTEDTEKIKAVQLLDRLGLSFPSYLRMCISRLNQENGIPFSMEERKEEDAYLVTGSLKYFPEKPFIVTPRQMLDIILKDQDL